MLGREDRTLQHQPLPSFLPASFYQVANALFSGLLGQRGRTESCCPFKTGPARGGGWGAGAESGGVRVGTESAACGRRLGSGGGAAGCGARGRWRAERWRKRGGIILWYRPGHEWTCLLPRRRAAQAAPCSWSSPPLPRGLSGLLNAGGSWERAGGASGQHASTMSWAEPPASRTAGPAKPPAPPTRELPRVLLAHVALSTSTRR